MSVFPPDLTYSAYLHLCGYAPRTLHLARGASEDTATLYVGCKDGSMWAVHLEGPVEQAEIHQVLPPSLQEPPVDALPTSPGVRCIYELSPRLVFVGRSNGALGVLDWRSNEVSASYQRLTAELDHLQQEEPPRYGGSVRSIGRIDERRLFVSFRRLGTVVVELDAHHAWESGDDLLQIREAVRDALKVGSILARKAPDGQGQGSTLPLTSVRQIVKMSVGGATDDTPLWLIATEEGEIFEWGGELHTPAIPVHVWPTGEEPTLVNDYGVIRSDRSPPYGPARGVFLATDRGVHLIRRGEAGFSQAQRLSLPGVGPVCMALTYVEDDPSDEGGDGLRFLWAVDAEGGCHLFCDEIREQELNLRPSGFSHLDSQVLLALAYRKKPARHDELGPLVFAQVRRDDRIALGVYEQIPRVAGRGARASARSILSSGRSGDMAEYLCQIADNGSPHARLWRQSDAPTDTDGDANIGQTLFTAALASEFVQAVAESSPIALEEFLNTPNADVSGPFLDRVLRTCGTELALRILDLWTVSFLGVVNRHLSVEPRRLQTLPEQARRYSLGLLRWLQKLEQTSELASQDERVRNRLETCARMVRKWGLFGEQNAKRESLARPIQVLQGSAPSEVLPAHRVDLLTYEALLFARGVDLLLEEAEGKLEGRSAWAISTAHVRIDDTRVRKWIAVSWQWGGIEIFRVREQEAAPQVYLELCWTVAPRAKSDGDGDVSHATFEPRVASPGGAAGHRAREIQRFKYGYSRAIHLGTEENGLYLLCSPAFDREAQDTEQLHLFRFPIDQRQPLEDPEPVFSLALPEADEDRRESLYSLLDLGGGRFVAGLRGTAGRAKLWQFEVAGDALTSLGPVIEAPRSQGVEHPGSGGQRPAISQNRVWSLARHWEKPTDVDGDTQPPVDADTEIIAGCENGEIWRVRVAATDGDDPPFELVARLAAPVQAVAYRKDYESPQVVSRVFAGATDGAIVAWQERPRTGSRTEPGFISLWATSEAGPVSDLQLWPYQEGDSKAPPVMLVATCRNGYCILFDDRHGPHASPEGVGRRPQRIQFPGNRHSRLRLESAAYAAHLCHKNHVSSKLPGKDKALLGVLIVATDQGTLRLVGLHHPRFTPGRREAFRDLVKRWWKAALNQETGGDIQYHLADAVYRAAPDLTLILVRWLLDPALDPDLAEDPTLAELGSPVIDSDRPPRWLLPRYLRPLLDLRRAWTLEPPKREDEQATLNTVGESLESGLRRARDIGDVKLYQEICECVFKRANYILFRVAGEEDQEAHVWAQKTYFRVFRAIEQTLESWQGMPDHAERRVRIVAAKNLVDGDTVFRIAQGAARDDRDNDHRETEQAKGPLSKVLDKRVAGTRQLIFKQDRVVQLEAIRAANLSLLRLCRRLVTHREGSGPNRQEEWIPSTEGRPSPQELRWAEFHLYFEQLTYAAARAFQSPADLGEALLHEYSRTFALAVCACPSAAIRIANRMTETRLIADLDSDEDLCRRVALQMELLGTIGVPVPPIALELFKRVTQAPNPGDDRWLLEVMNEDEKEREQKLLPEDLGRELASKDVDGFESELATVVGLQNAQDLYCLHQLHGILGWIRGLTAAMASNATALKISRSDYDDVETHLDHLTSDSIKDLYQNSYDFWREALDDLSSLQGEPGGATDIFVEQREPVSPRALFTSQHLSAWAKRWVDDLDERYRRLEIFQPEYTIFKKLLSDLELSARDFPRSAAVQKAVVAGVLGHHLLEDLDEHVLELEEIAHALDPVQVRLFRENGRRPPHIDSGGSMAQRFSTYLLRRAQAAESLPKNLRMLYGLLEAEEPDIPQPHVSMETLLDRYRRHRARGAPNDANDEGVCNWWAVEGLGAEWRERLDPFTSAHLELVLEELQQNHRKHSLAPARSRARQAAPGELQPRVRPRAEQPPGVEIEFRFELGSVNLKRLKKLHDEIKLDRPIPPSSNVEIPSSGTGLYLARLAAAVAGWHFSISQVGEESDRLGCCVFRLTPGPSGVRR